MVCLNDRLVHYSGDLSRELVWYLDHKDLFGHGMAPSSQMPGVMADWYSDHHLVNRPVFRLPFE